MRFDEFKNSDYEIHDRPKLDKILLELCHHIIKGQKYDPIKYGMVAACVLDPQNRKVFGVNEMAAKDNTRRHAERVAIDRYVKHYGDVPKGSIIITTLSPCNEYNTEMADERYGESCTDLINESNCRKVYCGYIDPSQEDEHAEYTVEESSNADVKRLCKKFADTFIDPVDPKQPKGMKRQTTDPTFNVKEDSEPFDRERQLVKKLGQLGSMIVQNPKLWDKYSEAIDNNNVDWIIALIQDKTGANRDEVMHLSNLFGEIGGGLGRLEDFAWAVKEGRWEEDFLKPFLQYKNQGMEENFADGRNPQDKGDSKRHGVPTKASVSTLRKVAKQGGRKGQLAHWMANMKAGRAKKK